MILFSEWKITTSQSFSEVQINKSKPSREEVMRVIREKANNLYQEVSIQFHIPLS